MDDKQFFGCPAWPLAHSTYLATASTIACPRVFQAKTLALSASTAKGTKQSCHKTQNPNTLFDKGSCSATQSCNARKFKCAACFQVALGQQQGLQGQGLQMCQSSSNGQLGFKAFSWMMRQQHCISSLEAWYR